MVWSNAGSTLYRAVERHNSAMEQPQSPQREKSAPESCIHTPKQQSASPLQELMRDRDMLLILAVLLLLLHEKADTKLILALAFVIFC